MTQHFDDNRRVCDNKDPKPNQGTCGILHRKLFDGLKNGWKYGPKSRLTEVGMKVMYLVCMNGRTKRTHSCMARPAPSSN